MDEEALDSSHQHTLVNLLSLNLVNSEDQLGLRGVRMARYQLVYNKGKGLLQGEVGGYVGIRD